jgi:tape measure domain-containing protein
MAGSPRTIRFNFEANANTQDLDKFSKSLNSLQQSLPPLSVNLEQARSEILQLGQTNLVTEKLIQGQITALRDLQTHVAGTSPLYRQLGNDLKGLKGDLAEITEGSKKAASATQELARALNSAVSGSGKGLDANVANLKNKLNDLKFNSEEYARVLQRITELETVASRRQGRTQVIATAAAYNDGTLTRGYGSAERLPELPQTTAGYQQRLSELSHELSNVNVGGQRYVEISREIASLNTQQARSLRTLTDELNAEGIALEGAARRAKKLADIAAATPAAPGRAGVRDPETGAMIARGSDSAGDRLAYRKMLAEIEAQKAEMRAAPLALPYGDSSLPAVRGGARQVGVSREFLGGARSHDEAAAALRQANGDANEALRLLKEQHEKEAAEYRRQATVLEQHLAKLKELRVNAASANINARRSAIQNAPSGFASFSQDAITLVDEQNNRDAINKSIARNRRNQGYPVQPVIQEASQLQQSINDIGLSKITNLSQTMGGSYKEVAQSIRAATQASDGSINSLNHQRASWEQLKNAVALTPAELREVNKELTAIDRKLEKTQLGGGGRLKRFAQTAGTVAASGVFGGPEGLIGASAGAFFGPEGAMAGGAIGAQVGMMRQSISDAASYAAELSKLNIALRGVAGSAAEYAQAQQVIASASNDFNVPTLEATQSMTKLAAAVKGAGGNVTDTELVYRGVSSAIKATGGSAEDVQSALLAMSQVFSKGKVSAEELQGQLGERLPGAVTLFAKATGRTLPQLSKDLQDGTVGLADLMKFVAALDKQYEPMARKLANSTEEAGARMTVALDKLKKDFGNFFKPVGAGIQDITTKLANMADAALRAISINARLQALGEANQKFGYNSVFDPRRALDPKYQAFVQKRISEIDMANGPKYGPANGTERPSLTSNWDKPKGNGDSTFEKELKIRQDAEYKLADAAKKREEQLADLREQTVKRVTVFERQLGEQRLQLERQSAEARRRSVEYEQDFALEAERRRLAGLGLSTAGIDEQQKLNDIQRQFSEKNIQIQDSAADRKRALELSIEEFKLQTADSIGKINQGYARSTADIIENAGRKLAELMEKGARKAANILNGQSSDTGVTVNPAASNMTGAGRYIQGGFGPKGPGSYGPHFDIKRTDNSYFPRNSLDQYVSVNGSPLSSGLTVDGGQYGASRDGGSRSHTAWDYAFGGRAALTLKGGAEWVGNSKGSYGDEAVFMAGGKIYRIIHGTFEKGKPIVSQQSIAQVDSRPATFDSSAIMSRSNAQATRLSKAGANLAKDQTEENNTRTSALYSRNLSEITRDVDAQAKSAKDQLGDYARLTQLMKGGLSPELAKQRVDLERMAKVEAEKLKTDQAMYVGLLASGNLTEKDKATYEGLLLAVSTRLSLQPQIIEGIMAEAEALARATEQHQKLQELAKSVADTIGNGMTQAIDSLLSGTKNWGDSLREIGSGVLKDIAKQLLQMSVVAPATKGIGNFLQSLIPAALPILGAGFSLGGAGSGSGGAVGSLGSAMSPVTSLPTFFAANGGIMTSAGPVPLRRYASGGIANSPQLAMYGEGRTPEAYVPLPDGRSIPVKLDAAGALDRYPRFDSSGSSGSDGAAGGMAAGDGGTVLAMNFETTQFLGQDWVSKDQLMAAMAATEKRATAAGAKAGAQQVATKMRTSPAFRRQVGI